MPTIVVVAALDTKGEEARLVRDTIAARGHQVVVVDTGVVGEPRFPPDIPASRVAEAGGVALASLREQADRGKAIAVMAKGAAAVAEELYRGGRLHGIIGMGGSAGTAVGSAAMRALPVGVPKVLVSTVASGNVAPYLGTKDIALMYSVVDVAGINRLSRAVLTNAAGAICGAVEAAAQRESTPSAPGDEKPLLAASMFGNTTKLVDAARAILEGQHYEVLVFHATGTGGQSMEGLIRDGFIQGVLDVTTTEWADELCGGVFSAGPTRLDAAGERGIPQVIAPGCLDMVNFGAQETVPAHYRDDPTRKFYVWNPQVTLMRTTPEENAALGRILAEKANAAKGPVQVFLPLRGVSILDSVTEEGPQPFWWPEADKALFDAIKHHLRPGIPVHELDVNINDPAFAEATAGALLDLLRTTR
ncbi:MAG TPA: Tm-1-like ATP-binding domain-containing protein [Chloroflexota bacterium]|nr:Tm-1-like ATP-binding domain-containing protein [Chloroflexota bacterium]